MTSLKGRRAFTLIELLIVITIIGILAAALLPRITSGPSKARDAQRQTDLQQIATALEFYADDHSGVYPSTGSNNCVEDIESDLLDYMSSVPSDPNDNVSGTCSGASTDGYSYVQLGSNGTSYILIAGLENGTGEGDGNYDADAFPVTGFTTQTFSDVVSQNADYLCGEGTSEDCNNNGIYYIVGR